MSVWNASLFAGKTVVVTGGSSGIGLGIAKLFAALGASVHIIGRKQDKLDAACAEMKKFGGKATGHSQDVRDAAAMKELAAKIGETHVLINAAAGNFPVPFSGMSDNAWTSVMDIVVGGTVNAIRAFGEPMQHAKDAESRSILNIVAGYAWTGAPGVSHSGAAKAAVLNLTKSLAVEWAPKVRCNAVSPGPIGGTEGMKRLGDDLGLGDLVRKSIPLNTMGEAQDIADACVYLASPAAKWVTGTCLIVDGGQDAVGPFGAIFQALKG